MKRAATPIAVLIALAFTGCSANPDQASSPASSATIESSPVAASPEQTETADSQNTPATDVDTDGPFAAESLEHLLTTLTTVYHDNAGHENFTDDCDAPFETLEEFQVCSPTDPVGYLASIDSPRDGVLIVTLMPQAWGGGEYDPDRVFTVPYLAGNLHSYIGRHTAGPLQVTTKTPDGEYQATEGRVPPRR